MNAWSRPLATLGAAAVGGVGLWLAGHWDTQGTGGYWAALGVVAAAGLVMGLAQLRSPDGNAPGMFLVAWVPVAVAAAWVIAFAQPDANTVRGHVRAWSADLGLADVAHYLSPYVAVLAFAVGLVFGFTLLVSVVWQRRRVTTVEETATVTEPVPVETVAKEPVAEEPVAEEPVAEEPMAEEPVAEEPVPTRRRVRLLSRS